MTSLQNKDKSYTRQYNRHFQFLLANAISTASKVKMPKISTTVVKADIKHCKKEAYKKHQELPAISLQRFNRLNEGIKHYLV